MLKPTDSAVPFFSKEIFLLSLLARCSGFLADKFCSHQPPFQQQAVVFRKKALIRPLYATYPAPNSRQKMLDMNW